MRGSFTTLFLAVVFAFFPFSHSQDGRPTMSGFVFDNKSHLPVHDATVTVVGNKANPESTDIEGKFILHFSGGTREGDVVRIRVEKTGYKVYDNNKPVSTTMPLQIPLEPVAPQSKGRSTSPTNVSRLVGSPIESLARLGWGIKENDKGITFEIMAAPLPDMKESAAYLQSLQKPFQLHLQQVSSIAGLELLSNKNCVAVEINASNIESTSELRNLTGLRSLIVSQTPFNDVRHELDIKGIASLVNLENLNLNMSRVSDLESIRGLTKLKSLNVGGYLVRDMSSATGMKELKSLDVRGSLVTDLSVMDESDALEELSVDEKQVPSLVRLSRLPKLNKLTIIVHVPVDITAVSTLLHLTHLFIWEPPVIDLAPIRKLSSLTNLNVNGFGFGVGRSQVLNVNAIGDLAELKTLTLNSEQIDSLRFLSPRNQLVELNLMDVPIGSVSELASISSLKRISFVDVPVVDISPLLSLPNLETLSLLRTPARADVIGELERRGVKVTVN